MSKSTAIRVRFESEGAIFYEATYEALPDVLEIGRSRECECRIPDGDKMASGHHAALEKTSRGVFIIDRKSRNGVYLVGQRIDKRKIEPGDIYTIGETKLYVERDASAIEEKSTEQYHKLEQLSGADRGKVWKLTADSTSVGSDPSSILQIPDQLVSRKHAVFEIKNDGSCWIRDLGSRNGTKVNGVKISADALETGRMLKDGDVVSIAFVDYRFLDRRVVHIRSNFMRNVLVVVVTLVLALGGYFSYLLSTADAKSIRLKAEQLAAAADFDAAENLLKTAVNARGADEDSARRGETLQKIALWRETSKTWERIKAELASGKVKLTAVNAEFASLISSNNDNWKWNATDAPEEMHRAADAHALLTALLTAEGEFVSAEPVVDRLRKLNGECAQALAATKNYTADYLAQAVARLKDIHNELTASLKEYDDLGEIMSRFEKVDDAAKILAELETVGSANAERMEARKAAKKNTSNLVRNTFRAYSTPVKALASGFATLSANHRAVARYEFGKYSETLELPTMDQCLCHPLLPNRRAELVNENAVIVEIIDQLKNFQRRFSAAEIAIGKTPPNCEKLFDSGRLNKVFDCDSLSKPQPGYADRNASGIYDETVGIHCFFSYLNSLDGDFDTSILDDRFRPLVFEVPVTLSLLESYLDYTYGKRNARLAPVMERIRNSCEDGNLILAWGKYAEKLESSRTSFVRKLYKKYMSTPNTREGIIAGGMALVLKGRGTKFLPDDLRGKVYESFRELRRKVGSLLLSEDQRTPTQKAKAEADALAIGIPGDSYLKQPWADRFKGGIR